MRNDSYIPGALVLAYALKMQSNTDRICLVTNAVTEPSRELLKAMYDRVIPVPEVKIKSALNSGRQDRASLLTRFNALRLGPDGGLCAGYDKILLLDADVLPLGGYDGLFDLPAPAGIIMEDKSAYLETGEDGGVLREADAEGRWLWHRRYEPVCAHGQPIPAYITDRPITDHGNMGVNSGLWLLNPSMAEYDALMEYLQRPEIYRIVTEFFPWPEMQLGTAFWSGRWTNIDARYCSIGGYPRLEVLYGTHFAGLKPWQVNNGSAGHYAKFSDFGMWYQFFEAMYWSCPEVRTSPRMRRIWEFVARRGR